MPSPLEAVLLGLLVLLLLLWVRPGLRRSFERGRHSEQRWGDLLMPIGAVAAFVLFLILIT